MWLLGALLRRRLCGDLLVGKFEEVRNSEVNDLCLPDLHVPFCQIHLGSFIEVQLTLLSCGRSSLSLRRVGSGSGSVCCGLLSLFWFG